MNCYFVYVITSISVHASAIFASDKTTTSALSLYVQYKFGFGSMVQNCSPFSSLHTANVLIVQHIKENSVPGPMDKHNGNNTKWFDVSQT